ncbi:MAG: hypothetical protein POELPBGB_01963 [Bacteroidia bacterium]|nr:hypothetical protein [Bacteroidia bacterium]
MKDFLEEKNNFPSVRVQKFILAEINKEYNQSLNESQAIIEVKNRSVNILKTINLFVKKPNQKSIGKKGKSEDYFENYLNKWFTNKIYKDYSFLPNPDFEPFQPDFIYQGDNDLHIDIEIDEPYDLETKIPLHYIDDTGKHIDALRDSFFAELKCWAVIRFSEEQVVRYPNECCKVIANLIDFLTGENVYKMKLEKIGELKKTKKWTIDDATKMSEMNYRNSYLSLITETEVVKNTWNEKIRMDNIPFKLRKSNPFSSSKEDVDLPF